MTTRKNIFISHHHGDDSHVDTFTKMLGRGDYQVRNSSVRMKPANEGDVPANVETGFGRRRRLITMPPVRAGQCRWIWQHPCDDGPVQP